MSTYVIGDLQGCLTPLKQLLKKISYKPEQDELWFTGDLVNRGPDSLATLRFVKNIPNVKIVLGNHDLALLACYAKVITPSNKDTIHDILSADDADKLITWLAKKPLLYQDKQLGFTLAHAGIPPQWDLETAMSRAQEVETTLQGSNYFEFLQNMYGNTPLQWHDDLSGWDRLRYIVNAFTRMRFCTSQGSLDLKTKGKIESCPKGYYPWFEVPNRKTKKNKIIFGHWAALNGICNQENVFALDTGCVWGNCLTAFCLETNIKYNVNC